MNRSHLRRISREQLINKSFLRKQTETTDLETNENIIPEKKEIFDTPLLTEQQKDLPMEAMKHKIVTYYSDFTQDRYYEKFARLLEERFKVFNVPYLIERKESKGSYMANCLMKPKFILEKLTESKSPIIWMDCDTNLIRPFSAFNEAKEDIGLATHSGDINGIKASPLFFNYTEGAFLIIREWILHSNWAQLKMISELDHDALKHWVLPSLTGRVSLKILSDSYQDYCNGGYIQNGNSIVPGKAETHRKTMGLGDANRANITNEVLDLIFVLSLEALDISIDLAKEILVKSSGFFRIYFQIDNFNIELESHKNLWILSGGRINTGKSNSKKVEIKEKTDIVFEWDKLFIEKFPKEDIEEKLLLVINGKY
jgi:hypothetical protein